MSAGEATRGDARRHRRRAGVAWRHGGVTRWTGKVALSRLTVTRVMTDAFRPDLRDPTFFRIRKSFGKA